MMIPELLLEELLQFITLEITRDFQRQYSITFRLPNTQLTLKMGLAPVLLGVTMGASAGEVCKHFYKIVRDKSDRIMNTVTEEQVPGHT